MPGHGGLVSFANQEIGAGKEATVEVEVDPVAHGPQGTGPTKKSGLYRNGRFPKNPADDGYQCNEVVKQPNLDIQCPSWV